MVFANIPDPDVQNVTDRSDEGHLLPIRRELGLNLFGISQQHLERNEIR